MHLDCLHCQFTIPRSSVIYLSLACSRSAHIISCSVIPLPCPALPCPPIQISEHLDASAESLEMMVDLGLQEDVFLERGVPIVLNYLSTYAQLQPLLPWEHVAHNVAYKAECALWSLLRGHAEFGTPEAAGVSSFIWEQEAGWG